MPSVKITPKSASPEGSAAPKVRVNATPRAQRSLNADRLSADDIEAIVTLRREPPASCRSLTHERQLRWLGGELAKAIAKLEQSPKIEERAIPKRTEDGLLARDSHGQIEYEVRRVPVAQDEVDRIEALLKATRDAYRAELKIGPRRRAALASAEERFLVERFGNKDQRQTVTAKELAAASAEFRAHADGKSIDQIMLGDDPDATPDFEGAAETRAERS